MAVQSETFFGALPGVRVRTRPAEPRPARFLTRAERVAIIRRRHRMERARTLVESAAWLAGGFAVTIVATAGVLGLR